MLKIILLLSFFTSAALADDKVCSNPDVIVTDGKISLNKNEELLVCGSSKSKEAWKKVPLLQAEYQLNVILQNLGYLDARFENDGTRLKVTKGKTTNTKSLYLKGTNGVVDPKHKRKIVGYPMIPAKLDEVSNWIELSARRQGHACPQIDMNAQAWDRQMIATIEPGPVQTIDKINRTGYGSLDPETLRRFEAFESGDQYDVVDTQITADRVMAQGLFQNAYITTKCHGDKVDLNFVSEVGKPKLLRFSFGASTEEFPFADVWFKNSRLDDRASSFLVQLHASDIRQTLEASSELYILPNTLLTYIGPRFKLERKKEKNYESNKAEAGADIGRAWDVHHVRVAGRVGPTFNYFKTVTGQGPSETTYLSWDGALSATSHDYEAFSRTQFEGWIGDFKYSGQRKNIGASLNLDRYELRYKKLWNLGQFSPPLLVIATRLEGIVVDPHRRDSPDDIIDIPVDLRIFYGGNENIRGFPRQTLNNQGRGFITAALAGFEFRLIEEVPWGLEPFLLWDTAKLGSEAFQFISPTFVSYGGGVRWVSPFGTLRFSAARGQIWNNTTETSRYPTDWVYFVSFGQEF